MMPLSRDTLRDILRETPGAAWAALDHPFVALPLFALGLGGFLLTLVAFA